MAVTLDNSFENKVILEGPNEKTWNRDGFSISLKDQYMKYIAVLLSPKDRYDYFVHFENETYPFSPYTEEEKDILFKALSQHLKSGDIITTEGGVTPGGISAFKKLALYYGFEIIRTHEGKSVYWASKRILDESKMKEWFANPLHKKDFKVIDPSKPITIENTKPVVVVLKKR
jgi:hypothetical protein